MAHRDSYRVCQVDTCSVCAKTLQGVTAWPAAHSRGCANRLLLGEEGVPESTLPILLIDSLEYL